MEFLRIALINFLAGAAAERIRSGEEDAETDGPYSVRISPALIFTFALMPAMGFLLLAWFTLGWIMSLDKAPGESGVEAGHFVFAVVFSMLGFIGMAALSRWRIEVSGGEARIRRLISFGEPFPLSACTAERVDDGIILVHVEGRKDISIDPSCVNAERFARDIGAPPPVRTENEGEE